MHATMENHLLEPTKLDLLLKTTPLQLAGKMAECRMLYWSTDDEEARDHWRGEYEFAKQRYRALLEHLKKQKTGNGYTTSLL